MLAVQVQSTKYTEQKWTGNCRNNPDESFAKISSSISNSIKLERGLNRQTSALKIKSFAKEQANSLKGSHQTSCIYSLWFAGQKKGNPRRVYETFFTFALWQRNSSVSRSKSKGEIEISLVINPQRFITLADRREVKCLCTTILCEWNSQVSVTLVDNCYHIL